MKKSLLLGLACTLGLVSTSNAQTYITNPLVISAPASINVATPFVRALITGNETNTGLEKSIKGPAVNPYTTIPPVQMGVETIIGITTYDLQSNSAVQNRVMNNGDGTVSAVWTYSESYDVAAADRGTGYNYFDGSSWGPQPTSRIEVEKTGWPNIGSTASGKELFMSHNITQTFISQGARSTIGSGPWTMSNVTLTNQVWNRMAIGGANGETVHQISLFDPIPTGNPWTNGVQSQLLYWRSTDGGVTNDIAEVTVTGLDENNYSSFSGDSYHIAAKGDTVVIVYFGALAPTMMSKSIDNGVTWTATEIINVFPPGVQYDPGSTNTTGSVIGISDINGDGIFDTVPGSDGAGWVLLDHDGMAHIFFGNMEYVDDTEGDDQWSYFPGMNGMMYWNENFGDRDPVSIGGALDLDGNGALDILTDLAGYNGGLSSYPSAGIDANGCIYLSYSAIMENMDQGSQNYRHIYITKSCDNGCSWTNPKDVTPGSGFEENVYGSMAHLVDANIHLVWQRDFEPGIAVNGDLDAFVSNDIVHSAISVTDTVLTNASEVVCIGWADGDSLFCSGDSVWLNATCGSAWSWSDGQTTQGIWYKGVFGAVTVDITTPCGIIQDVINVSAPSSAPSITVAATKTVMCDGEQSTMTVTSNAGGTIAWTGPNSYSATTSSITVDSVGTYIITVTNCGGIAIDSVVIVEPGAPVFTITATSTEICNGDSTWITASSVPQGTVLWSTGETTWTIGVDSVRTYTVAVTNCGGTTVDSIMVTLPSLPNAVITGNDAFCPSDSITLMVGTQPSASYLWSTGATTQSIVVSDEAMYEVFVTNCAGTDSADVTTGFENAPTVSLVVQGVVGTEFCEVIGTNSVKLTAYPFGATPFTFLWTNGDTIASIDLDSVEHSGVYNITVTDACGLSVTDTGSTNVQILAPAADTVSITNVSGIGLSDGSIFANVTGGTPPYTYDWSDGQTTLDATGLSGGVYTLDVTDANGCASNTLSVFVDEPVGINDVNIGSFSIQPNPNNGNFVVNLDGLYNEEYSFVIRNIIGQTVYAEAFNGHAMSAVELNLSESNKGVYFLTISNSKGKRTEKLIIH